jgi:hypothetical protein
MYLAYVDDSGDSESFALGAILIPADDSWLTLHDQLVAFRQRLSKRNGFRMGRELKSTHLMSRGGPWRKLGASQHTRHGIFKAALRELGTMAPPVQVFAVVIPDRRDARLNGKSPIAAAWEVVLERLRTFCLHNQTTCLLRPDDGNPKTIRRLARRHRRFSYVPAAFGGQGRRVPFGQLIDDPAHNDSSYSYELQWADLVAYAAFRTIVPRPNLPADLWQSLGAAQLAKANEIERTKKGSLEPPGLIVWPGRMR